jgi:prepilin-type N-terminal cleavage/methylation domain-containing protein
MNFSARTLTKQAGFTLVEMLIVMLIIAILAGLAIPAFFSQGDKATDATAKSAIDTAHTALEAFATESGGSFADATLDDLKRIEAALNNYDGAPADEPSLSLVGLGDDTYTIEVLSETGTTFSLSRDGDGQLDYDCSPLNEGGCPASGNWGH